MTKDQILALDPVALTIEAHRILGKTIEWHSGVDPERDVYCNWRCTLKDGSTWTWIYHDVEKPTEETLDRLQVERYAWSWDAAAELFEHESWPVGWTVECISLDGGRRSYRVDGWIESSGHVEAIAVETEFPLVITRAFVLAHHGQLPGIDSKPTTPQVIFFGDSITRPGHLRYHKKIGNTTISIYSGSPQTESELEKQAADMLRQCEGRHPARTSAD